MAEGRGQMSRDWTQEELQAASEAMKAAGYMSYEEFCEELKRQQIVTNLNRDEFYHALDDFLCAHPETEGMDITSVRRDSSWYAVGELNGVYNIGGDNYSAYINKNDRLVICKNGFEIHRIMTL